MIRKFTLIALLILLAGIACALTTPSYNPMFTAFDSNGDPLAGGKLYTYYAGTTTAKTTWTDYTKATPNSNPVVLDSAGRASVWIDTTDGAYKFVLKDSDGVSLWTMDNITNFQATSISLKSSGYTATPSDDIILVDTGVTDITIQIEDVNTFVNPLTIINIGSNSVIIDPYSTQTVNGSTTEEVGVQYRAAILHPDTANNAWVDTEQYSREYLAYHNVVMTGYLGRSNFTYKDADEIYIGAGAYEVSGVMAYWASTLTSPATGAGVGVTDWYYLYIDYSAIPASGLIDNGDIYWSTGEPSYSNSKRAWYHQTNTDDRCVFAVYIVTGNIYEFFHTGDRRVLYANGSYDISVQDLGGDWTDAEAALLMPSFATAAQVAFLLAYVDTGTTFYWRTNGQTGSDGHVIGVELADVTPVYVTLDVITDTAHLLELYDGGSGTDTISAFTEGFFLPNGF